MTDLSDFSDRELLEVIYNNTLKGKSEVKSETSDAHCNEHGVAMEKRWSEKKQKNYLAHNSEDGQICFGKGYLAKG